MIAYKPLPGIATGPSSALETKTGKTQPTIVKSLLMILCTTLLAPLYASSVLAADTASARVASTPASVKAWQWAANTLLESEKSIRQLATATDKLLVDTNEKTLEDSRTAWLASQRQWLTLRPLLQLSEQAPQVFRELDERRFTIDASNLEPGYLDALPDYPHSGLVNDIALHMTAQTVRHQHGLTDASEVSLGFHALELLLWGADGKRSSADFELRHKLNPEQQQAGYALMDLPNNRRRELMQLITQMLLDDVHQLQRAWQNHASSLSQAFLRKTEPVRHELLRISLQDCLSQLAKTDASPLNAFAGDRHYRQLAPLEGTLDLLTASHLLDNWIVEGERHGWLEHLRAQITALRNSNDPYAPLSVDQDEKTAAIAAELTQLAERLLATSPQ